MILATACFCVGIFADRTLDLSPLAIAVTGSVAWIAWLVTTYRLPRRQRLACGLLYLMIVSSGALWHHARWNWFPENDIGSFLADGLEASAMRGIMRTEPIRVAAHPAHPTLDTLRPRDRIRFRMQVQSIRDGSQWKPTAGIVRASILLSEEQTRNQAKIELPSCGDLVEVTGSLLPGRPTTNPGQFDFRNHARSKGELTSLFIDSTDGIATINRAGHQPGFRATLRAWIDRQLHAYLPQQQAAFASAVLLGNRDQMDLEVRQRFLKTGTSHLLAISGLHVGILASGFLLLLKIGLLSRRNGLYLTILFVLCYAWLVEFRPTVLRASILICVMCGARLLGKTTLSWRSLSAALLLVLIFNPNDLFSLGAQLSFLAISTTIIGKPWIFQKPDHDPLQRLIAQSRPAPVQMMQVFGQTLRTAFCVSFLIWIIGLPLVAARFHSVALISPLINPLLILPLTLALYAGIALVCFSYVVPWTASIPAFVCAASLASIESLIDFGSQQPLGHRWVAGPSDLAIVIFYLGLFAFAVFPATRLRAKWCILLGMLWLVFGWLVPSRIVNIHQQSQQQLQLTVIDVRHGSAALVQLPDGKNLLFDCGSLSGSRRAATTISEVLWDQGIDRLDGIFISHADVDHFNALPLLLERFEVNSIWTTEAMVGSDAGSVQTFSQAIKQHSVPIKLVGAGTAVNWCQPCDPNGPKLEFLGPPSLPDSSAAEKLGDNDLSLVASLKWKGRHILLPGDVEGLGLESLLKWKIEKVDLLIAAHHGSKHSEPQRFARWCEPDCVVVSCGAGRFSKQGSDEFKRGHRCDVFTTDQSGAVRCLIDSEGDLTVEHWDGMGWTILSHASQHRKN